jgi:hypothetical protein
MPPQAYKKWSYFSQMQGILIGPQIVYLGEENNFDTIVTLKEYYDILEKHETVLKIGNGHLK